MRQQKDINVGDDIYVVTNNRVKQLKVKEITISEHEVHYRGDGMAFDEEDCFKTRQKYV